MNTNIENIENIENIKFLLKNNDDSSLIDLYCNIDFNRNISYKNLISEKWEKYLDVIFSKNVKKTTDEIILLKEYKNIINEKISNIDNLSLFEKKELIILEKNKMKNLILKELKNKIDDYFDNNIHKNEKYVLTTYIKNINLENYIKHKTIEFELNKVKEDKKINNKLNSLLYSLVNNNINKSNNKNNDIDKDIGIFKSSEIVLDNEYISNRIKTYNSYLENSNDYKLLLNLYNQLPPLKDLILSKLEDKDFLLENLNLVKKMMLNESYLSIFILNFNNEVFMDLINNNDYSFILKDDLKNKLVKLLAINNYQVKLSIEQNKELNKNKNINFLNEKIINDPSLFVFENIKILLTSVINNPLTDKKIIDKIFNYRINRTIDTQDKFDIYNISQINVLQLRAFDNYFDLNIVNILDKNPSYYEILFEKNSEYPNDSNIFKLAQNNHHLASNIINVINKNINNKKIVEQIDEYKSDYLKLLFIFHKSLFEMNNEYKKEKYISVFENLSEKFKYDKEYIDLLNQYKNTTSDMFKILIEKKLLGLNQTNNINNTNNMKKTYKL